MIRRNSHEISAGSRRAKIMAPTSATSSTSDITSNARRQSLKIWPPITGKESRSGVQGGVIHAVLEIIWTSKPKKLRQAIAGINGGESKAFGGASSGFGA